MSRIPAVFLLFTVAGTVAAQVRFEQGTDSVRVDIDGKPYTAFFYGPESGHPYLHPLRAASGTVVTRGYPMQKLEGESTDHQHHRGLWFAHSDVNGFDFWNNEKSYTTKNRGNIVFQSIDSLKGGPDAGSLAATFEWRGPDNTAILREQRTMTFYSGEPNRKIDFDFTLTALITAKFGDEKDGVFAIRVAAALEEKEPKSLPSPPRTGEMVSSSGCRKEAECWGKRSEWMDYHGEIAGEKVGIAIFDNPANPRYPTYWHARGYGLFAANIFGTRAFTKDKTQDGTLTLQPGEQLRLRYRVVVHPGDEKTAKIAELYASYLKESAKNTP